MAQPDNLLSIVVTGKHNAASCLEQCSAVAAGGIENFRTTLQALLTADQKDITNTAESARKILATIAGKIGVTRDAIEAALATLTDGYHQVMVEIESGAGIPNKKDPRHEKASAYKRLHATCQAYAIASIPVLEARIAKMTSAPAVQTDAAAKAAPPARVAKKPAPKPEEKDADVVILSVHQEQTATHGATEGTEPADAGGGEDDGLDLIRQIVEEASGLTKPGGVDSSKPLH